MKKITLILLLITQMSFGQTKEVLAIINKIEFKEDTVKSVFDWVAENIKYDVNKLNKIKEKKKSNKNSKFKNDEEYTTHLLKKVIKQKKGVCEDYSLLFDSILKELGYESSIIRGYTKNSKGKINRSIGHTWNAVMVKGKWKLYDPTWAAGYVNDGNKFVKKYNLEWHDVDPEEMIRTHMPMDPMWQLLEYPLSYQDFESNNKNQKTGDKYNYESIIQDHKNKNEKAQMQDQLNRSKEMGDGIRLIARWRKRLTKNIGLYGLNSQPDLLEKAKEKSNSAVKSFNTYLKAKKKRFKGKKWTVEIAEQNLKKAKDDIQGVLEIYKSIDVDDKKGINFLNKAIRHSEKLLKSINKEFVFLEKL